jgi:hypothetical protein
LVVKKRIPTSLKVDPELWEEVKIMSIRTHKNITEYFEGALREKLVKDYEIVAAESKRKEQERLHREQLEKQYQNIVGKDPGRETTQSLTASVQPTATEQPQPKTVLIDVNLPGIEFPADKSRIVKSAEEANSMKVIKFLKYILDKEYKNKSDLKNELLNDVKSSGVDFKINTEKLRKEQCKEKIIEQERQVTVVKFVN